MESSEQRIHLSRLRPSANNPRGQLGRADWADLVPSVKEHGVIQPILIRPVDDDLLEIVAGERRYRAANEAFNGEYEIPYVMRDLTDQQALVLATIENMQRERMNPAKEAEACQLILSNLDGDKAEAARQMGWTVETLERRLALMACTPKVREALVAKKVLLGHAELLAAVPPTTQDVTLDKVIANNVPVTVLKQQLGQFARRLSEAPFEKSECATCRYNSNQQSQLFGEALGDGYCTHPTHYDEKVLKYVEDVAAAKKDAYPVVRIVQPKDGFVPLPVHADGELGVGTEQYEACKGCATFGCSVSAMPGSYGAIEESLCFNAECNSKKIAAQRKAERQATKSEATKSATTAKGTAAASKTAMTAPATKPEAASNSVSTRIKEYRVREWRKWAANELMLQPDRNQRVLIAVLLSSNQSRLASAEFRDAVNKVTGSDIGINAFDGGLKDAERIGSAHLSTLIGCVAASAAFGIDEHNLDVLLNYLDVEEAKHFKLNAEFLELFTKSELESLASELKLKKAMGDTFGKVKDAKKDAFIKALLSVPNVQYDGLVPKVMRYKRKAFPFANREKNGATEPAAGEPAEAAS